MSTENLVITREHLPGLLLARTIWENGGPSLYFPPALQKAIDSSLSTATPEAQRHTPEAAPDIERGYMAGVPLLSAAAQDLLAERNRQITAEGWTPAHDDEHACDEIAAFACFYAMPPAARDWDASSTGYGQTLGEALKPEGWQGKTGDRRRELIKAGALILAEIERLDRSAAKQAEQEQQP